MKDHVLSDGDLLRVRRTALPGLRSRETNFVSTLCMQLFIHTVLCAELSLASLTTLANSIGP
jgi:hypothetical protein